MKKTYTCIDIYKNGTSSYFDMSKKELKELKKMNKESGYKYEKLGKGIVTYVV